MIEDKERLRCELLNKVGIEKKKNELIEIQKQELQMQIDKIHLRANKESDLIEEKNLIIKEHEL